MVSLVLVPPIDRELLIDDLDDPGGAAGLQHVAPTAFYCDLGDELFDDLVADVGLRRARRISPHGLLYIGLRQRPLPRSFLKAAEELPVSPSNAMGYSFSI